MEWLKMCWRWFWGQSVFNKIIIIGLFAAFVPFVLPTVVAWFRPTMIHVGVAFYTYERGVQAQGMNTLYFFERRNLVSDCSIRRDEQSVPNGHASRPRRKRGFSSSCYSKMYRIATSRICGSVFDRLPSTSLHSY